MLDGTEAVPDTSTRPRLRMVFWHVQRDKSRCSALILREGEIGEVCRINCRDGVDINMSWFDLISGLIVRPFGACVSPCNVRALDGLQFLAELPTPPSIGGAELD